MFFHGDMVDDEAPLLSSLEDISESPEPCLPLRPQNHQHQARHQQQLSNSYEPWLRGNLLNVHAREQQCFFSQSSVFTMNQIEIGRQGGQGNGFAHPTMAYSHEFPNHLQVPLIQQESSDAFGSLFPQRFGPFPNNNLSVITTTSIRTTSLNRVHLQQQQHRLYTHTLSTRESLLNNQYHHHCYHFDQIVAVNTEHSSPIEPSNLIPNRSQNYMPYQTYVPITSSFNMNGQQLPPSVLDNRRNEAHNLSTVNNSATQLGSMQRSVHQSSSRFRLCNLCTQMHRRAYVNSSLPPRSGVVGSRRGSYESRSQFGEPSSSTRRRRTIPADEIVGSTSTNPAEQRRVYKIYDPEYERRGLYVDPHLRKFFERRNGL